jgi:hypothetical protein
VPLPVVAKKSEFFGVVKLRARADVLKTSHATLQKPPRRRRRGESARAESGGGGGGGGGGTPFQISSNGITPSLQSTRKVPKNAKRNQPGQKIKD